jgi:hypothetical protein
LGEISPKPAAPATFRWPWTKGVALFLPALILLPFLALKPNRRPGTWLMLIPFVLVAATVLLHQMRPASWLSRALSMANSYFMYAGMIFPALRAASPPEPYLNFMMLASGLCLLCLMLYAFPSWRAIKKLLVGLFLLVLPGVLTLLLHQRGDEGSGWGMPVVYTFLPLCMLVSLALAGRMARKRWNVMLFAVLLFGWNYLLMLALRTLYMGSALIRSPSLRPQWWDLLRPRFTSWQGPTTLFVIPFLFVLAAFLIPSCREQMKAVFNVVTEPQPQPAQPSTAAAEGSRTI